VTASAGWPTAPSPSSAGSTTRSSCAASELGEIEAVLGACPGVGACAVVVREDAPGALRLVGYVVGSPSAPAPAELRGWLTARLPEHMVPSAFVALPAMPLTKNGKVDRRALPPPEGGADHAFVAPRTPTEEVIARIWEEVLALRRVGVFDDFFALGGHSLLATKVMARLGRAMHVDLPLRTFFEVKTVAGLAEVADLVAGAGRPAYPAGGTLEEGEL
jgi:hypothetical protein